MTPRTFLDSSGLEFPRTRLDDRAEGMGDTRLAPELFTQIKQLAEEGQRYLHDGDPDEAFEAFYKALDLLPDPHTVWNASGWLLVAMGTTAIRAGAFADALEPLQDAMKCPGTVGNPWVHLLFGQVRFEIGDKQAAEDLGRAYAGAGREIFDGLHPKYLAMVEDSLAAKSAT
ncbi:MAG: Tetratricopeptide repeat [Deltaproteobacteria bacterium]|nr:Tetratricopeptide repeat [Deltaproteobacteria bacterium]